MREDSRPIGFHHARWHRRLRLHALSVIVGASAVVFLLAFINAVFHLFGID